MVELIGYIVAILGASVIVWKGGGMLEKSAEALSIHYNLPPIAHGSIVTAVGSSFPELSTTVISTLLHGQFDLGVSAIVGSAIFNILVIPGLSVVLSKGIKSDWNFVIKDVQFYVTSVAVLLLIFALAALYYPTEHRSFTGELNRTLAMIPVIFYGLYLFFQQQETKLHQKNHRKERKESSNIKKEWGKFVLSLILILISVEGLVRGAMFLGDYFGTPGFIWGVLVLAPATSVPDAIVSVKEAMHKKGMISMANVIGSNIFDLLIAVPAGVLIAGTALVDFSVAAPMMLFLAISTVILILFMLSSRALTIKEGWLLLLVYGLFIFWIVLESLEIMNWIG